MQKGRIFNSREKSGAAIVKLSESYSGNAQFDLDLRLADKVVATDKDHGRSFVIELFFPSRQQGVTLGIGDGKEGVMVSGRSLSLVSIGEDCEIAAALPMNSVVVKRKGIEGTPLKIKHETDYKVRVRRVGDAAELLINGKRVAYVKHAGMKGEVHLLVGSPYGTLNIGRTVAMSLSDECILEGKEPVLGEFGYVVSAQGKKLIVDSDMYGLEVNGKVTVMKMGNFVKGEKSTSIILERVAQGIVSEIGPRTAKILVTDQVSPVQRGMKVFSGQRSESLVFTDDVLHDLEQGL